MHTEDLVLDNGVVLKYRKLYAFNVFHVFDQLRDGEYGTYGFSYYARVNGAVYQHKGNWDSAHSTKPGEWEKVHG